MKHRVAGRKLGRTSAHRLALLRNLSTDLFRHERIHTTLMKAKELRPFAEKLITMGRRGDVHARRRVARDIHDAGVAKKLVETIATRFAERPGGYTRILKLGPRRGDSAEMAIVELIGSEPILTAQPEERKERKGLGRIRERFSRRKSAPKESTEAAAAAVEDESAEPESSGRKVKKPKPEKPKAKSAPEKGKSTKASSGKPAKGAKPAKRAPTGGAKKGGQSPKKGG